MISVTVHYPKESAEYLTSQFYQAGYSLSQRIDILNVFNFGFYNINQITWIELLFVFASINKVLVISAQKLSNPSEEPIFDKRIIGSNIESVSNLIPLNQASKDEKGENNKSNDWREIVHKRIESKTKYKKKNTATAKSSKENKYSNIYGHFFFALIRPYDV
jgi:hypothetical protein